MSLKNDLFQLKRLKKRKEFCEYFLIFLKALLYTSAPGTSPTILTKTLKKGVEYLMGTGSHQGWNVCHYPVSAGSF